MHQVSTMDRVDAQEAAPFEVRSLQQQVHDRILGQILRGELLPEMRLSPPEIASSLGVSVTPVRDALNLLAAEGLVIVAPRRGTIVAPVSPTDIEELYQIRLMIEPGAAALAAARASEGDVAKLSELARRLEEPGDDAAMAEDLGAYLELAALDADFHTLMVSAAGNGRLLRLYQGLRPHVMNLRSVYPRLYRTSPHRRGEHIRILEAIVARNPDQARTAVRDHLEHALADTIGHIRESESRRAADPSADASS